MIPFSSFKPLLLSEADKEGVAFIPFDTEPHPRKIFVIQKPRRSFLWLSGPKAFTLIQDSEILAMPCLFLKSPQILVDHSSLRSGIPPVGALCCTQDLNGLYFMRRDEGPDQRSPCWHFASWRIVLREHPEVEVFSRIRLRASGRLPSGKANYSLGATLEGCEVFGMEGID